MNLPIQKQKHEMKWDRVVALCEQYVVDSVVDPGYRDRDTDAIQTIFEEAMEAVYGQDIFQKLNNT